MLRRVLAFGAVVLLLAGRADATVYSWRDGDGAFHFTNQPTDVPAGPLEAFHTFTESKPPRTPVDAVASDPPPARDADPSSGYAQGLEEGLRIGEEQGRLAAELARTLAEASPPVAESPFVIAQPPAVVVDVVPPFDQGCGAWGSYGFGGCSSWLVGPAFFERPFFRHSRSFRGEHRFGRGLFFPGGRGLHGGGRFFGRR